jgi:hypothetical protein
MSGQQDQDRLLHAMAWETANVHLGTTRANQRIIVDLKNRPGKWLRGAAKDMARATVDDWKEWKKAHVIDKQLTQSSPIRFWGTNLHCVRSN